MQPERLQRGLRLDLSATDTGHLGCGLEKDRIVLTEGSIAGTFDVDAIQPQAEFLLDSFVHRRPHGTGTPGRDAAGAGITSRRPTHTTNASQTVHIAV